MSHATRRFLKPALAALLTAVLLAPPRPAAGAVDVPGAGGVRVNGTLISQERIWAEYNFQIGVRSFIHAKAHDEVDTDLLRSVIKQAANRELLDQESRRLGYGLSEEERAGVYRTQVESWKGEARFKTAAVMMGVSEEFLLRRGESSLRREKLARGETGGQAEGSEEELRGHYEANVGSYLPEQPPPMRYIFVPAGAGKSLRSIAGEIIREADALRRSEKGYISVVERYSRHESAARGGVVPEKPRGGEGLPLQPSKLKECRLFAREDGEGLHVYLRDCRRPLSFDEARSRVVEDIRRERTAIFLRDTLSRLRKEGEMIYLPLSGEPPPRPGTGGH